MTHACLVRRRQHDPESSEGIDTEDAGRPRIPYPRPTASKLNGRQRFAWSRDLTSIPFRADAWPVSTFRTPLDNRAQREKKSRPDAVRVVEVRPVDR